MISYPSPGSPRWWNDKENTSSADRVQSYIYIYTTTCATREDIANICFLLNGIRLGPIYPVRRAAAYTYLYIPVYRYTVYDFVTKTTCMRCICLPTRYIKIQCKKRRYVCGLCKGRRKNCNLVPLRYQNVKNGKGISCREHAHVATMTIYKDDAVYRI